MRDRNSDRANYLENADLQCEPQNSFVSAEEVKPIDDQLDPGEKVHFLFTGGSGLQIDGEKDDRVGKTRTAITNQRILIKVGTGILAGTEYKSIHYDKISGVSLKQGIIHTALVINTTKEYKIYVTQEVNNSGVGKQATQFIRKKSKQRVRSSRNSMGNKVKSSNRSCLECGEEIYPESNFCTSCGTELSDENVGKELEGNNTENHFDKLERLNELKEAGAISEDEFNNKKQEILDRL